MDRASHLVGGMVLVEERFLDHPQALHLAVKRQRDIQPDRFWPLRLIPANLLNSAVRQKVVD